MLPWGCTTPVIRLLLRGLHKHGSKNARKCSHGHVFYGVREQKWPQMLPWGCTTPVIRLLLRGLHKHGSKNRPKCSRGFASTLYTPSVRGSAQAREQKHSKMLPRSWFLGGTGAKTAPNAPVDLQAPFIRLLLRGLHRHGCKNTRKCSRGLQTLDCDAVK